MLLKLITTKQCTQRNLFLLKVFYATNSKLVMPIGMQTAHKSLIKNTRYSNQMHLSLAQTTLRKCMCVTWFVSVQIQSVWKEHSKALFMQTIHIILKIGEAQWIEMHLKCASRRIMAAFWSTFSLRFAQFNGLILCAQKSAAYA